ncbi:MAG TPA: bifunctional diaminohydroxyphosphoribosylaminopyrimidine deaminase/5-amino-6-(5-phosphoribosylamino)uracil reductase RibD [Candidatus Kryptonia bacterium]
MLSDEDIMLRCIRLAANGLGSVSPNPLVGCVIVKDGRIIGEGYHEKFGGPHAEVNAIRSATEDVAGSTVYVNLEPCDFQGKTPPCTDLLIEKRVKKVIVAMLDPNPRVNGGGVKKLRAAGVEVELGVCAEAAHILNEVFTYYISKKLPFVVLKVAQSIDGKVALKNGRSKYITSADSLRRVHELRRTYDSVLVGAGTVRSDDPLLTVRLVEGRSPKRIILDGKLSVSTKSKMFRNKDAPTILFYSKSMENKNNIRKKLRELEALGVETHALKGRTSTSLSLTLVLRSLTKMQIASVLVEGGVKIFSDFINQGLVDKIHIFVAPKIIGAGKSFSDGFELSDVSRSKIIRDLQFSQVGPDLLLTGYFK